MTTRVPASGERYLASGERTYLGYDNEGRLRVVAPTDVAGDLILYAADGTVSATEPVMDHVGGLRDMIDAPITGSLASGGVDRFAFTVTAAELNSSPSGQLGLMIELTGTNGLNPAQAKVVRAGVVTGSASGTSGLAFATISEPGTFSMEIAGANGSSGDYAAAFTVLGDINRDGVIGANDAAILQTAFGTSVGQPAYNVAADLNRDDTIDASDRPALNVGLGTTLNRVPTLAAPIDPCSRGGQPIVVDLGSYVTDPDRR